MEADSRSGEVHFLMRSFKEFYGEKYPECNFDGWFILGEREICAQARIADTISEYLEYVIREKLK